MTPRWSSFIVPIANCKKLEHHHGHVKRKDTYDFRRVNTGAYYF